MVIFESAGPTWQQMCFKFPWRLMSSGFNLLIIANLYQDRFGDTRTSLFPATFFIVYRGLGIVTLLWYLTVIASSLKIHFGHYAVSEVTRSFLKRILKTLCVPNKNFVMTKSFFLGKFLSLFRLFFCPVPRQTNFTGPLKLHRKIPE